MISMGEQNNGESIFGILEVLPYNEQAMVSCTIRHNPHWRIPYLPQINCAKSREVLAECK